MIKLNIGCGPNIFPYDGWTNYDRDVQNEYFDYIKLVVDGISANPPNPYYIDAFNRMPKQQKDIVLYIKRGKKPNIIAHNVVNGFPQYINNTVDFIVGNQMIEHFNKIYEVPKILSECYRILKPGGIIRLSTPDLDLLLNAYINNDMDKFSVEQPAFYKDADKGSQLAYLMFGASGPNCNSSAYEGHFFIFNKISMTKTLKEIGFKDIEFYYETNKSKSSVLCQEVVDTGMTHSFIVEGVK